MYRWRFVSLALAAILALVCIVFGPGAIDRLDAGGFEVTNGRVAQATELAQREFGAGPPDVLAIIDMDGHTPRDREFQSVLKDIEKSLTAMPRVDRVQSPASVPGPRLISHDGASALVTVSLSGSADDKQRAYTDVAAALDDPRIHAAKGGPVAVSVAGQDQAEHDLVRTELIALPIVAVLLVLIFRGVVAATLPLAVGGLAIGLSLVSLRLLAHFTPVAVFALNIVTFLGLGLAIDYSLFIVYRFREELAAGREVPVAVHRTVKAAGKTVAYSGLAVAVSLLALLWFPIVLLRSIAVGGAIVVIMTVAVSTIVLPAALGVLGKRIDTLSWGRRKASNEGRWHALALGVMRHPGMLAIVITAAFLLVGTPFLRLQTAISDARIFPADSEVRRVQERLSAKEGFAHLGRSSATIVLEADKPILGSDAPFKAMADYEKWLADRDHVVDVTGAATLIERKTPKDVQVPLATIRKMAAPHLDPLVRGRHALVEVSLSEPPGSLEANALVRAMRDHAPPGFHVALAGQAAVAEEVHAEVGAHLHVVAITIATVTFVVLVLAFGAIPVALKAVFMNILSLTTSFGAMVFIFQDGRLERWLNYQSTGAVDPLVLVLMFAIVFGLSMDYELFLLSRVREEWDRTGDPKGSVARGLENTAGLITSAALLLVVITGGFATSELLFLRQLGIGMALAIIIDAGVIRPFLVPSTMALMRRYNWWAPKWFERAWKWSGVGIHEGDP